MLQYQKFQLVLFLRAHNEACFKKKKIERKENKKKKNLTVLSASSHGKNEWQETLDLKETANPLF